MKCRLLIVSLMLTPSLAMASPASIQADAPLHRAAREDWMVKDNFAGFLGGHPDMYYHRMGAQAYKDGDFDDALRLFRKSARYADKPSQAMIADILWNGRGVEVDRAAAYAWMDLAAERNYPLLVKLREAFWAEMTEAERQRALEVGESVYAIYGDDVAQKRIAAVIRRGQRSIVGSRTGFRGTVQIVALPPGVADVPNPDRGTGSDFSASALVSVDGSDFFADTYWNPKQYFKWRELQWTEQFPAYGEVGPLRVVADKLPTANSGSGAEPDRASSEESNKQL